MSKTVIITGASGNLGRAVVNFFLNKNWFVIALVNPNGVNPYRNDSQLVSYAVDVPDEKSVMNFMSEISEKHPEINAAIMLVGGYAPGNIAITDAGLIHRMIDLNFYSAYHISRMLFNQMKNQQSGNLIFIGSNPATDISAAAGSLAYALSKSLLYKLSDVMNFEGKKHNIKSKIIVPGTIDTPQNRMAMPEADFSKWQKPEDIAERIYNAINSETENVIVI